MTPKQFVIVDFEGGLLGWAGLALLGTLNVFAFWFLAKQFWRLKFGSAEWRKYADAWSWVGVAILAVVTMGSSALCFAFVVFNAVWRLTH